MFDGRTVAKILWFVFGIVGLGRINPQDSISLIFLSNALFVGPFLIDYVTNMQIIWKRSLKGTVKFFYIISYLIGLFGIICICTFMFLGMSNEIFLDQATGDLLMIQGNILLQSFSFSMVNSYVIEIFILIYLLAMNLVFGFAGNKIPSIGGEEDVASTGTV
ncbi:hypothetical protein Y306_01335 [Listeria monocytogenes]|nr:hypothetical protein [Listeria monocytogenes]